MSYLITCAGSKRQPIVFNPSNLQSLSFSDSLYEKRLELLELTSNVVTLNWDLTLPAWQLYSGTHSKLYPRITSFNWTKESVDIRILSALFGWIKHTDLLPYYDLSMTDNIPNTNQKIWKYWYNTNLLNEFVEQTDIDLLSVNYRKAIWGNNNPVAILPDVIFNDYGVQKGNWLNTELNNIV